MKQADSIFKALATARSSQETFIACLYTQSRLPAACAPMPRKPNPTAGLVLGDLKEGLRRALAENPAVHDGAIMVGRLSSELPYRVTGWSYRLFPTATTEGSAPNRGSAFHSCLAMSLEPDVDATYLVSGGRAYRFSHGDVAEL